MYDHITQPNFKKYLHQAKKDTGLDHGFSIINKTADKVTIVGFAAPKKHRNLLPLYLNELPLFYHFIQYYIEEMNKIIIKMENDPIELYPLLGNSFLSSGFENVQMSKVQKQQFLHHIKYKEVGDTLSEREKQCLQALLQGKSAKATAAALDLSPRTVEHYLENAKQKLACYNKSDLFAKAKELKNMGLLENILF